MLEKLSTGLAPKVARSVLSGPIFSGPHDFADLVLSFKALNVNGFFQ